MHAADFRDDLPVTRGQWQRIAEHLCRLAGEPVPSSRIAGLELLLRLESSKTPATPPEGPAAGERAPAVAHSARHGRDRTGADRQ